VNQQDEQEIETRLRAALLARSEQVTHQSLRPGVVPNAHTANAAARARRGWNFSWRSFLVPVAVAAALTGGVFVGVKLPQHSSSTATVSPGAGPGGQASPVFGASTSGTPAPSPTLDGANPESSFGGLQFQLAGWSMEPVGTSTASVCLLPPKHAAPDAAAELPCGVDALMIKSDATTATWPVSGAKAKDGWWPVSDAALADIPCPAIKPGAGTAQVGSVVVKNSDLLRNDAAYPLSGTATADYREWTVICTDGTGLRPMLWQTHGGKTVVTAISASARNDADLLRIVASMRPAGQ
jgi:hypothetical protein